MSGEAKVYAYAIDGETYHGSYPTRGAAAIAALQELSTDGKFKPDQGHILIDTAELESVTATVYLANGLRSADLVESIALAADDDVGECSEDWMAGEQLDAECEGEIRAALERWVERRGNQPTFRRVVDVQELELTVDEANAMLGAAS